jgi:small-conductance mechanosensitive channel
LIVKAAGALEMVLQDPPPAVYIESLAAGGAVTFFCVMFVAHPREVMKSRSLLYHTALEAFIQNKVAFSGSGGPQEIVVEPGARLEEALRAVRPAPGASEPRAEMESAGSRSAPPGRPTTG